MASTGRTAAHALAPLFAALLAAACGSSNDASTDTSPPPAAAPSPPPPPPPPPPAVTGTAAVGAALAAADVAITDSTGASVCSESPIVTSGTGTFNCTVLSGKTAPFMVVVTTPSGAYAPLVSVVTTTPTPGEPLVANATPLTTAIIAQLAPNGDPLSVVSDRSLLDLGSLEAVKNKILAQLEPTLTALSAPAGYDPFTTAIVASTASQAGNTADAVIEVLRFSVVNGVAQVSTIDNPDAAVPLAGLSTNPPQLPPPPARVVQLAEALRYLATRLNECFALSVSARVVAVDNSIARADGGPEVTETAPACAAIVTPEYRHNGYRSGQHFYGLLNDTRMVGAVFSPLEVVRFIDDTTAAESDRAVVNLRYVDGNGVAGNVFTVAQRFFGTSTTARPSEWWLHGNQQPVDSSVQAFLRRNEQLAPNVPLPPFTNASLSRYETGLNIFVNKDGPGSAGMRAAKVTGPGLPPNGLVLVKPDPAFCTTQDWLNIGRKDGLTDPGSTAPASIAGNIFRLQRTVGITGTDATTVRPNPNGLGTNNTAFPDWAHPLDYGAAAGATNYIDFSSLKPNTTYTIEIYYDGEAAARHTVTKTMVTAVIPATRGGQLQWINLDAATRQYLDPLNALAAAQASISLAWTANPLSETIRSAGVYTFGAGGIVNQGTVGVARGATSAIAAAPGASEVCTPGTTFPALTNDGLSGRSFQLRYRMLDGSYRDSFTRFN